MSYETVNSTQIEDNVIELRPYQNGAIQSLYKFWQDAKGNPLIVLPTGTGKSVVLAQFIREALEWGNTRIVVLTHVKELIEQDYAETMGLFPQCPSGIYSAGMGRRDINAQVLFAGIQSIYKRAYELKWADLIIIDEAHLIPTNSDTMYRRFLDDIKEINPLVKFVGLTATPYRMDSGMLTSGENALFDGIAYEAPLSDMIEQGYLSPLISKSPDTKLDISDVGKRGGEYIPQQLQAAVDIEEVTRAAVDEIVAYGHDRKSWALFCSGVDHAFNVRDEVRSRGIKCETIVGDTDKDERARIIADFKDQKIQAIASMNVLTTGFNAPQLDLIAMLRPTASTGLYVQMAGRGTRNAPGKTNCLVLDFAGNVERHGPVDLAEGRSKEKRGDGSAPCKVCPQCKSYVLIALPLCPDCGYEFPPAETKIDATASFADILSDSKKPRWHKVTHAQYALHNKPGKPPSMRVTYFDGLITVAVEWICFQHEGYARTKAEKWWAGRMPERPCPNLVKQAILQSGALPTPSRIWVKQDGKFSKITDYDFDFLYEMDHR